MPAPEIDAGGAFRGLRSRLGASLLHENRRQTNTWERDALAELRAGDADQALDSYVAHDRVHQASTDHQARELLVEEWMNARAEGEDVLMVASRLADVDDLNGRARRILQDEGYLGPDQIRAGRHAFAEGDEVLALRNDYRLGVLNGTRAVIDRIDTDEQALVVVTDSNERREIPFEYVAAGHLTHGYATTIHKAQGATVDRCLILADDTASREHAYTALSRGRHGNDLFVVTDDPRVEERHAQELQADRFDGLRSAIRRTGGKRLALDDLDIPSVSRLDQLRADRQQVKAKLGPVPPAMSFDTRRLMDEHGRATHSFEDAQRRLRLARDDLADLGPIGRRTHPGKRRAIEQRIADFEAEIAHTEAKLAGIGDQLAERAPAIRQRATWEHDHRPDLDRLDNLDRRIDMVQRLDNIASRGLERGLERSQGIELGL